MGGSISDPVMGVCSGVARLSGNRVPRICVETGTYRGESTARFAAYFDRVNTIELSEQWYAYSREKLAGLSNVTCHLGDSVDVLRELLPSIAEPAVFFLDAHYSGGSTAMGTEEVPLLRELGLVCGRNQKDIVIIDDARLIGGSGQCGYEGDSIYPRMAYDWRSVTMDRIRALTGSRVKNTWISWWDKIIVLRNQTVPQGLIAMMVATPFNLMDFPMRVGKRFARAALQA
jgi:hypothetical protein